MARRRRRPYTDYIIMGLLALLLLWLLSLLWDIVRKEEIARHAASDARAELDSIRTRKESLEANLAMLETARGEEATYRETYGVAKPGEEVIIVVPPPDAAPVSEPSLWDRIMALFDGK